MSNQKRFALLGVGIGKIDKSDALADGDILVYNATTTKWETKQLTSSAALVEAIQDTVGAFIADTSEIDFTYNDAGNALSATLINNSVAYARIVNASAVSVLGRSANSSGVLADITAAADDRILRRTASTVNFGQLTAGMFPNTVVPDAALSSNVPLLNVANTFTSGNTIFQRNTNGAAKNILVNLSAGTAAYTSFNLYNDQNIGTRALEIDYSSSTYSGALVSGALAPTGEQGAIGTVGAFPLVFYTNNTAVLVLGSGTDAAFALPIRTVGYTVATLPAGTLGQIAHVTDALSPAFLTAVVGGGAVKSLVFYNGANWVAA